MTTISEKLLLVLLAVGVVPAVRGQIFFPVGLDHVTYAPRVPGTPAGRIYVGDHLRQGNCHFRLQLQPGKPAKQIDLVSFRVGDDVVRGVAVTTGEGYEYFYYDYEFERVDKDGNPCDPVSGGRAALAEVGAGAGAVVKVAVSNDADSFAVTCDGRFAVVVGANSPTPVSLVDFATRKEVDRFAAESNVTWASTFDDGESVVVLQNIPPRNATNRLRRLKIVEGRLVDTGETLAAVPNGDFPDYRFKKVLAVAGAKVGVAIAEFGNPRIITFGIPGLRVLDSLDGAGGHSGAVSCRGDAVYVRAGSRVRGYTLDPVTGALGDAPFLSIGGVGEIDVSSANFGNALSISRDGTRLIVTEGTEFPDSPPTPRTSFFDTITGARVGFSEDLGGGSPTLVATAPCCGEIGLRLGIRQLPSGLMEISAVGNVGPRYELQKSRDLVVWDTLQEFRMTASPTPYADPDSPTNSTRFYRLKLIQ